MTRQTALIHKFVEFIPDELEPGTLYVCIGFATVVHKCCCGCGNEVVTPLSPTDWKLIFDGETISLYPSIGNWGFECRSHYWIRNNRVKWATHLTRERIEAARARDQRQKNDHFVASEPPEGSPAPAENPEIIRRAQPERGFWRKLKRVLL
jgi:hypothetical protein